MLDITRPEGVFGPCISCSAGSCLINSVSTNIDYRFFGKVSLGAYYISSTYPALDYLHDKVHVFPLYSAICF